MFASSFPLLSLLFLVTILSGCKTDVSQNTKLEGTWSAVSWEANGQRVRVDPSEVSFVFTMPDKYTALMGSQSETGIFRVDQHRLYTTGENQIEKKVGIQLPHPDTMLMEMNRMGKPELLILARQK